MRPIPRSVIEQLKAMQGDRCASCGATNVPLHVVHLRSLSIEGPPSIENLILLCPNCSVLIDSFGPRERDLTQYLLKLLEAHPDFRNPRADAPLTGRPVYLADLLVERREGNEWSSLLLEVKNRSSFSSQQLENVILQLRQYGAREPKRKCVFVAPTRLLNHDRQQLEAANIEIWDIDYLASLFRKQIDESSHPYFRLLFKATGALDPADPYLDLIRRLKACPPGRDEWAIFQKLVGEIFATLFTPPLEPSLSELPDLNGVNRRDFVFPNYADEGFWSFLRDQYRADYIVIDAKNYKGAVSKVHALQIANYLKPHGAGLFGIIICRDEADSGCLHTLREQWIAHRKMIVVLGDREVESMLLAASSGGSPDQVIGRWIQEFRLKL